MATISKSSSVTTLVKLVRLGTFGLCAAPRCDNFGFTCTQNLWSATEHLNIFIDRAGAPYVQQIRCKTIFPDTNWT